MCHAPHGWAAPTPASTPCAASEWQKHTLYIVQNVPVDATTVQAGGKCAARRATHWLLLPRIKGTSGCWQKGPNLPVTCTAGQPVSKPCCTGPQLCWLLHGMKRMIVTVDIEVPTIVYYIMMINHDDAAGCCNCVHDAAGYACYHRSLDGSLSDSCRSSHY